MTPMIMILTAIAAPSSASVAVTMVIISITGLGAVILKKFSK